MEIKCKAYLILLVYSLLTFSGNAQQKYWIFFKDKSGVEFNPYEYFDPKAIERRLKHGIPLYDSTDFPINTPYIEAVENISGSRVHAGLRWFNAVLADLSPDKLPEIEMLPFVKKIEGNIFGKMVLAANYDTLLKAEDKRLLENQINRLQGNLFHAEGLTGKGIRIAVFDAGFPGVNKLPVFNHLIKNNQIKGSWDFARKKPDVYSGNPHGTMVLSCIAGKLNNRILGMAVDAEFLLARTEIERESFVEEQYWLQAVEWADKNGADIISSSLAYTYERYYTFEMNGETSLVARAANLAATKGMLVINAMGNDGGSDWKILATPADADSVLSVGSISPLTDFRCSFSSFGPTAGYKMKPNVVAPGRVMAAGQKKIERVQGTSFSAPLITGFAACVWQAKPFLTNMQVFEKIEQSGHLYPYFDYAHGFGAPQASFFVRQDSSITRKPTFSFEYVNDTVYIHVNEDMIDKKFSKNVNYLFYHIENENGYLDAYWLIDVFQRRAAIIPVNQFSNGTILRAHYRGYTEEIRLK